MSQPKETKYIKAWSADFDEKKVISVEASGHTVVADNYGGSINLG